MCYLCNTSTGQACGPVKVPDSQGVFTADSSWQRKFSPLRSALSSGKRLPLAGPAECPGCFLPNSHKHVPRAFPCSAGPAGAVPPIGGQGGVSLGRLAVGCGAGRRHRRTSAGGGTGPHGRASRCPAARGRYGAARRSGYRRALPGALPPRCRPLTPLLPLLAAAPLPFPAAFQGFFFPVPRPAGAWPLAVLLGTVSAPVMFGVLWPAPSAGEEGPARCGPAVTRRAGEAGEGSQPRRLGMLKLVSLLQRDMDIAVLSLSTHTEACRRTAGLPEVTRLFALCPDTLDPGAGQCTPAGRRRFSPCASPLREGHLFHSRLGCEMQCFSTKCSHRYVLVCRDCDMVWQGFLFFERDHYALWQPSQHAEEKCHKIPPTSVE